MPNPSPKPRRNLAELRGRLWLMVAAVAVVLATVKLVQQVPAMWHGPYGQFAKGPLVKLAFKHAGEGAPRVSFLAPDGKPTSLAAFKGKVVLLNLWATWCAPCISELPSLDALAGQLGSEKFQVVAVIMEADNIDGPREFLAAHKLRHLALYSDTKLVMDPALGAPGIPASVLYDAKGHEIARLYGPTDWSSSEARALIAHALEIAAKGN